MIRELLTSPTAYFEERVKYPKLKAQFIIVCLVGLVANLWRIRVIDQLGAAAQYFESILVVFIVVGVIEFLFWWLVLTFVMHALAIGLGGKSSYGDLLRLTGFGFFPMLASGVIWSIGWAVALSDASAPNEPPRIGSFEVRYALYREWLVETAEVYTDPVLLAALLLGSVFVVAAGFYWVRAVEVVSGLDQDRAAVAAGVALLILLFRVFNPLITATADTPWG